VSVHQSLKSKGALVRSRNVLSRYERIAELRRSDKWREGQSPYGLPKVRVLKVKKRAKAKKEKEEDATAATPAKK